MDSQKTYTRTFSFEFFPPNTREGQEKLRETTRQLARLIDVSRAAARYLGLENRGTARVRVRYAGRAPLSGDDRHEQRFLASQSWFRVALSHPPASESR